MSHFFPRLETFSWRQKWSQSSDARNTLMGDFPGQPLLRCNHMTVMSKNRPPSLHSRTSENRSSGFSDWVGRTRLPCIHKNLHLVAGEWCTDLPSTRIGFHCRRETPASASSRKDGHTMVQAGLASTWTNHQTAAFVRNTKDGKPNTRKACWSATAGRDYKLYSEGTLYITMLWQMMRSSNSYLEDNRTAAAKWNALDCLIQGRTASSPLQGGTRFPAKRTTWKPMEGDAQNGSITLGPLEYAY